MESERKAATSTLTSKFWGQDRLAFFISIQHCTGSPGHCNKARKRNKKPDWKEIRKTVLTNSTNVHSENTMNPQNKPQNKWI